MLHYEIAVEFPDKARDYTLRYLTFEKALLVFDVTLSVINRPQTVVRMDQVDGTIYDDEIDAARAADREAELAAERQREYEEEEKLT